MSHVALLRPLLPAALQDSQLPLWPNELTPSPTNGTHSLKCFPIHYPVGLATFLQNQFYYRCFIAIVTITIMISVPPEEKARGV